MYSPFLPKTHFPWTPCYIISGEWHGTATGGPEVCFLLRLRAEPKLMLRVCNCVETAAERRQRLVSLCARSTRLCCDSETKLSMAARDGPRPRPPAVLRRRTRPRASLGGFPFPRPRTPAGGVARGPAEVESLVLLRPPRRRPEHRAPELAPGDALVAVLVQRVDRAEHVVRAHVDAEHLGELLVVP